jgi:hypothetical protein
MRASGLIAGLGAGSLSQWSTVIEIFNELNLVTLELSLILLLFARFAMAIAPPLADIDPGFSASKFYIFPLIAGLEYLDRDPVPPGETSTAGEGRKRKRFYLRGARKILFARSAWVDPLTQRYPYARRGCNYCSL